MYLLKKGNMDHSGFKSVALQFVFNYDVITVSDLPLMGWGLQKLEERADNGASV